MITLDELYSIIEPTETWKQSISENLNPAYFKALAKDYTFLDKPSVSCPGCQEGVQLPHLWIIQNQPARIVSIIDVENNTTFKGWQIKGHLGGADGYVWHPHAQGASPNTRICTASETLTAVQAIINGLNPGGAYFNVWGWLDSVGHICPKGPPVCPHMFRDVLGHRHIKGHTRVIYGTKFFIDYPDTFSCSEPPIKHRLCDKESGIVLDELSCPECSEAVTNIKFISSEVVQFGCTHRVNLVTDINAQYDYHMTKPNPERREYVL